MFAVYLKIFKTLNINPLHYITYHYLENKLLSFNAFMICSMNYNQHLILQELYFTFTID